MSVDDALLPAARHLFGPDAEELLRTALAHVGARLLSATPVQAQHRPGHDLVVRFDADVEWSGRVRRETLLAAATVDGPPDGTLPLEAGELRAGVWRYPFDPCLPALTDAVTPRPGENLEVLAYRPTRRAVVRASGPGDVTYRKVVRPREVGRIVAAHERLATAGPAIPAVLQADPDAGLLVLSEVGGRNLRDLILRGEPAWPSPGAYGDIIAAIAAIEPGSAARPAPTSLADATRGHARALLAVMPQEAERLERILGATSELATRSAGAVLVHGDLYEAQVMVSDGTISGVLDLDDVRLGEPRDDAANLLAHMHALRPDPPALRERLARYRRRVRRALLDQLELEPAELDAATAAVLVGLATGPFRAQTADWRSEVRRRLATAERLVGRRRSDRERSLRIAS